MDAAFYGDSDIKVSHSIFGTVLKKTALFKHFSFPGNIFK